MKKTNSKAKSACPVARTAVARTPVARAYRFLAIVLLLSGFQACGSTNVIAGNGGSSAIGSTADLAAEPDSAGPTVPWEGLLDLGTSKHWVLVDLDRQVAVVPELLNGEAPLENFRHQEGRRMNFVIPTGQLRIQAALDFREDHYSGNVLVRSGVAGLGGASQGGRLELHPPGWMQAGRALLAAGRGGEELVIPGPAGTLAGTLLLPENGQGPWPVLILVAGSGPTDRDGNSNMIPGGSDNLRQTAEHVASLGYAAFRYDKRVVGASTLEEGYDLASMTFQDNVADLEAWRSHLAQDPRLGQQVLFGHSEGSTVVLLSARQNPQGLAGVISAGGNGDRIDQQILEQVERMNAATAQALARDLERLAQGEALVEEDPMVRSILYPQVQTFLRSWMLIDPAVLVSELEVPVQILWGDQEERISRESNQLLVRARPSAEYREISGANHLFKLVGTDPLALRRSFEDPSVPLAPEFLVALEDFLARVAGEGQQE